MGFGYIAVLHLETEVINALAIFIEKTLLRRIQHTGVTKLDLDIVEVRALIAHGLGCRFIRDIKLQILARLRIVEPRPNAEALIISHGLLKVFDDDADVVKLLENSVHMGFSRGEG